MSSLVNEDDVFVGPKTLSGSVESVERHATHPLALGGISVEEHFLGHPVAAQDHVVSLKAFGREPGHPGEDPGAAVLARLAVQESLVHEHDDGVARGEMLQQFESGDGPPLDDHAARRGFPETGFDPLVVPVERKPVVQLVLVLGVHAERDRGVDVVDPESLQQVAEVDGPSARAEPFFPGDLLAVCEILAPLPGRQQHGNARDTAVPREFLLHMV